MTFPRRSGDDAVPAYLRHLLLGLALALAVSGCSTGGPTASGGPRGADVTAQPSAAQVTGKTREPASSSERARAATRRRASVRVVAAGDIACAAGEPRAATTCRQAATAALALRLRPRLVLPLGDEQYQSASLTELRGSYARSWGRLLSLTRPAPGNHEYKTPGAAGYYRYFANRQPGPPGYYAAAVGRWKIFVLNSNCDQVSCVREAAWLGRVMAAHPSRCSLVTMHHPRYSSGAEHGDNPVVQPLWAAASRHHNDVVLAGHDHDYERFVPKDATGASAWPGMSEFVVGTGGKSLYHLGTRQAGSAYYQNRTPGLLVLDLRAASYHWAFRAIDGSVLDQGTRSCT